MAIASCLVDTNILLRITRRSDPQHKVVDTALARLAGQGATLHYTHQNIAEFWNAMTRPIARNGLGLTTAEAEREVQTIESGMSLLPDSEAVPPPFILANRHSPLPLRPIPAPRGRLAFA